MLHIVLEKKMSKELCTREFLLLLICIDLFNSSTSYVVNDANDIYAMLSNESRYNKLVPPDNLDTVSAGYTLHNVNSLDLKSQTFSTTGFFTLEWQDDRLKWNTGSRYIFVPENKVWHPNLIVFNLIEESQKSLGAERPVQVYNNGTLVWKQIAILSTFCSINVFFFPFDRHRCELQLVSLDLPIFEIELKFLKTPLHTVGTQFSVGEWRIGTSISYDFITIGPVDEWKKMLTFIIEVARYPSHYIMIIIVPTAVIAVLTFVTFFLPLKSGVRIGYILTVVLALVVLLTLFAETMPQSSRYPSMLVITITVALGMALLLVIITIFLMSLYNKPKHCKAPNWMHSLVRKSRKFKLKCRARRITHLEQHQAKEADRPTGERDNVENSAQLKPYSNKELAAFFDYCLFVAYTVLYILGIIILLIIGTSLYVIFS
ncbi:acetylcholine receptor subunit alpha-like 1 [Mytilus californianus]|uniref:acetylcholine receptor subunit alpha-like 1 n=1 Tax=Mytilus californianus TaxID=6549 RepID=UPI002247613C|nr:acetylcholine receptor subunit alpha-like 1 [Mytilus californianus]